MSHQEQHYAGIHYHNVLDVGFSWKDHPPRPFNSYFPGAITRTEFKNCPVCNTKMLTYMHYPVEKRIRAVWQCKVCNRLFVFIWMPPQTTKGRSVWGGLVFFVFTFFGNQSFHVMESQMI